MKHILKLLEGTDRRLIGRSDDIASAVLADPTLFAELFRGLSSADPLVRMRSADVVEKVTALHPEYLHPYKSRIIRRVAKSDQQEIRWHVAQLFSRLSLTPHERRVVIVILNEYLTDKSSIVKTCAMQALADLAEQDVSLRPSIIRQLGELTRSGTPAMQSRGRKLLAKLQHAQPKAR